MKKQKHFKKPNWFLYIIVGGLVCLWAKVVYRFKVDKTNFIMPKRNFIVVANHTSFLDFIFLATALFPHRINFVVAKKFVQTKFLGGLLRAMGSIPKSLFEMDYEATKSMLSVAKFGGNLSVYPEGQISATGVTNKPMGSIAKLAKKMEMPVISVRSYGVYFVAPPWGHPKKGKVLLKLSNILSEDDVATKDLNFINSAIYNGIYVDNSKFSDTLESGYKGKKFAEGLHNLFFVCPKCKAEYTLSSVNDYIKCSKCDSIFKLDEKMKLHVDDTSYSIYSLFKKQREEYIQSLTDDFELTDKCTLRQIKNNVDITVTQGTLKLNKHSLRFNDLENNCLVNIDSSIRMYIPYEIGEDFQINYNNVCYYFQLEGNKNLKYVITLEHLYKQKNPDNNTL